MVEQKFPEPTAEMPPIPEKRTVQIGDYFHRDVVISADGSKEELER
ncbi:hypothetical protein BURPS1655_K0563 [Burkholderia pseudomallei 1655]|nr:hypothetical protein BURPS1655_K0563 [Burkholderia pseudomallei 1655]